MRVGCEPPLPKNTRNYDKIKHPLLVDFYVKTFDLLCFGPHLCMVGLGFELHLPRNARKYKKQNRTN
jgi:hypothetical protein